MARVISGYDARRLGEELVKNCNLIYENKDEELVRASQEPTWLPAQVGNFALYIRTLAKEEGKNDRDDELVSRMVEALELITKHITQRTQSGVGNTP